MTPPTLEEIKVCAETYLDQYGVQGVSVAELNGNPFVTFYVDNTLVGESPPKYIGDARTKFVITGPIVAY